MGLGKREQHFILFLYVAAQRPQNMGCDLLRLLVLCVEPCPGPPGASSNTFTARPMDLCSSVMTATGPMGPMALDSAGNNASSS